MRRRSYELLYAFVAAVGITVVYLIVVTRRDGVPEAGGLVGHGLGIAGFLLMLMTETLYSLRKRSRVARWGRMSSWLRFHIFTGLVGPYMVLLHTAWRFQGLAGVVLLFTVAVVASGFIGRYIYTAVPRTADGAEVEAAVLEAKVAAVEEELAHWQAAAGGPSRDPQWAERLDALDRLEADGVLLVLGRVFVEWGYRLRWWRERRALRGLAREQARTLDRLLRRRRALRRQVASLAMARRTLSLWHSVHIPLGVALFTAAFVHIAAALYYATLLR